MIKCSAWLLFLAGAILSKFGYAQDSQCIFDTHKGATVSIKYSYTTNGDGEDTENGTGFIVSPDGYVITNAHVVTPSIDNVEVLSSSITVCVGGLCKKPEDAIILDKPEDIDKDADVALLKLPSRHGGAPWPTVPVSYLDNLPAGSPIMGLGFPLSSDISIVQPALKTSEITIVDETTKPWWQTSLGLLKGNSGGPIFGKLGTAVGIAVRLNRQAQSPLTYIIPIASARKFLDKAGVRSSIAGPCAQFPACRHPTHGLERYSVDQKMTKESPDWRPGGGNPKAGQPAWCAEYLEDLQKTYPASTFTFIDSRDSQKQSGIFNSNVEYKYECSFQRREGPIYNEKQTIACLK